MPDPTSGSTPGQRVPRFGANYTPSRDWWHAWQDWDRASIGSDLQNLAGLGLDHIRAHCLWPVFQPNPNRVSRTALDHLEELLDLAGDVGLDVSVTVLNGWLSGFAFYPAWKTPRADAPARNMFTDPGMIAAEKLLFSRLAERIAGHPRFLGFDLGNELGVLQFGADAVNLAQGDAWQAELFAHLEQVAPGRLHVNGVDHQQWFATRGFSRRSLATLGAATSVHAWIEFTGALERYGPNGVGSLHLAEYCIELAKAFHEDPARRVWLQEFGASSRWMPVEAIPGFAAATIANALDCDHLWGLTWWCSHDLNAELSGFHPLEYDLGLFDQANREKPVAGRLREVIADARAGGVNPPTRTLGLVLPGAGLHGALPDWGFAARYMELIDQGERPAVVLEERAGNAAYLAARGIAKLVFIA